MQQTNSKLPVLENLPKPDYDLDAEPHESQPDPAAISHRYIPAEFHDSSQSGIIMTDSPIRANKPIQSAVPTSYIITDDLLFRKDHQFQ